MDARADDRKVRVQRMVSGYSIEFIPSPKQLIEPAAAILPAGTRVFLPYADSTRAEDVVAAAVGFQRAGMVPIPHIPARRIRSHEALTHFVRTLREQAAVDTILLLGGDRSTPVGPYASSTDILQTNVLIDNGITSVGFAGHPEGHPVVPDQEMKSAMAAKLDYSSKTGLAAFAVTQFAFDAQPYLNWHTSPVGTVLGDTPVLLGVPGLAGLKTLIRFASECGVGTSLGLVRKNMARAIQLAKEFQPDQLVADLALKLPSTRTPSQFSIHLYPFGSFARSAAWATAVASGEFDLSSKGKIVLNTKV